MSAPASGDTCSAALPPSSASAAGALPEDFAFDFLPPLPPAFAPRLPAAPFVAGSGSTSSSPNRPSGSTVIRPSKLRRPWKGLRSLTVSRSPAKRSKSAGFFSGRSS
jgi:hypothetical protein